MRLEKVKIPFSMRIDEEELDSSQDAYINLFTINEILPLVRKEPTCHVVFVGGQMIHVCMSAEDLANLVNSTDPYTGEKNVGKNCFTKFDSVMIGENIFELSIYQSEFKDGISYHLILKTNFPVKNNVLKSIIENTVGVENAENYMPKKYELAIYLGKLFDPNIVRNDVEVKIKEFLSSEI